MLIMRSIAPLVIAVVSITSLVLGGAISTCSGHGHGAAKARGLDDFYVVRDARGLGENNGGGQDANWIPPLTPMLDLPIGPSHAISDGSIIAEGRNSFSAQDPSLKSPLPRSLDQSTHLGANMSVFSSSRVYSTSVVRHPTSLQFLTRTKSISSTNILYIYYTPELEIILESAVLPIGDTSTVCNTTHTTTYTDTLLQSNIHFTESVHFSVLHVEPATYTVTDSFTLHTTTTFEHTLTQTVYYTATSTELEYIDAAITNTVVADPTYV